MVWQTLEAKLSTPRMNRYLKGHQCNQEHAAAAYVHNMRIAESLVSIFHVLEVGLRNSIQREMVASTDVTTGTRPSRQAPIQSFAPAIKK